MSHVPQLTGFYNSMVDDASIGATHISLYMALFHIWQLNGFQNPITITRKEIMRLAKIGGVATYHKCLKDLVDGGYIRYLRSFNPCLKNEITVLG